MLSLERSSASIGQGLMCCRERGTAFLNIGVHRDVDMMNRSRDRRAPSTAAITVPMSRGPHLRCITTRG